jgi:DNA repair exonuclease SbcCD nuclease subunit
MFRFIHTSDLHLDAPLRSLALKDQELFELVGTATRLALERIVDICLEEQVNALLIPGDLYDGDMRSMKTAAYLIHQMERLNDKNILVFIVRGNHDAESVITKELVFPPNVKVFSGHGGVERIDEHEVAVHGVSFAKPHAPESLLPKYDSPIPGWFNIGLLHTSLAGAEGHDDYAPCSVKDLQSHGYDYWALGHVHKRQVHAEKPYVIMPGMPQGRDIGETGPKSLTLASVDNGIVILEERHTSIVEFNRVSCLLDGETDWRNAVKSITEALKKSGAHSSEHNVLRIVLEGKTPLAWQVRRDHDLLVEQIREAAQSIGSVWIEKIENYLTLPETEKGTANAQQELRLIMQGLSDEASFSELVLHSADKFVGDLPPEVRHEFGDTETERFEIVMALLSEGVEDISARMMNDNSGGND